MIRPTVTTTSLTTLKRLAAASRFLTLIGEFAARCEIDTGDLFVVLIDPARFRGT